jgi:hypothetical protein
MKLTFWAEGENADVNTIKLAAVNLTNTSADWDRLHIYVFHDVNNNSVWDFGVDSVIQHKYLASDGTAVFLDLPLFTVKQREAYDVVIAIIPDFLSRGWVTLSIGDPGDVRCRGVVSGLNIAPNGAFPMNTTEREIRP